MKRQPEREQLNRLTVKTLDQVFIMRVKEGLGCSQFEAEALTDLVKYTVHEGPFSCREGRRLLRPPCYPCTWSGTWLDSLSCPQTRKPNRQTLYDSSPCARTLPHTWKVRVYTRTYR